MIYLFSSVTSKRLALPIPDRYLSNIGILFASNSNIACTNAIKGIFCMPNWLSFQYIQIMPKIAKPMHQIFELIRHYSNWMEPNFHKLACNQTNLDLSIKFRPHRLSINNLCIIDSHRVNRRDGDRSYGLVFLMIVLGFILFIMLMVPSIIQPPVLYIGVIFSLLSIIFIIAFMNSYMKQKSSHTRTADRDDDTERQLSVEAHHFTDTIALDVNDGQSYCETQVSMTSSDLPPKYEPPPSYSQTIYSINIWLKRIAKRWWLVWYDDSGGQDCHSSPQSATNVFTQRVVYMYRNIILY